MQAPRNNTIEPVALLSRTGLPFSRFADAKRQPRKPAAHAKR